MACNRSAVRSRLAPPLVLKDNMYLQDNFHDYDIENFYESMTFIAPPSKWKQVGHTIQRILELNDEEKIVLVIDPQVFPVGDKVIDFLNIGFLGFDSAGNMTEAMTYSSKNSSNVIGAVANALLTKLPEFEYSALSFIARDNIKKRMSLYSRIIRNKLHHLGQTYQPDIKMNDGGQAIVVFSEMNTDWSNEFIGWLKTQNKI